MWLAKLRANNDRLVNVYEAPAGTKLPWDASQDGQPV